MVATVPAVLLLLLLLLLPLLLLLLLAAALLTAVLLQDLEACRAPGAGAEAAALPAT